MKTMTNGKTSTSSALIEALYALPATEQKILLGCIGQVDHGSPITDKVMYSVPVASIAKAAHSNSVSIYQTLLDAALELRGRAVSIELEPDDDRHDPKRLEACWVQSIAYSELEGVIDLRFNQDMLPYLNEFKKQLVCQQ